MNKRLIHLVAPCGLLLALAILWQHNRVSRSELTSLRGEQAQVRSAISVKRVPAHPLSEEVPFIAESESVASSEPPEERRLEEEESRISLPRTVEEFGATAAAFIKRSSALGAEPGTGDGEKLEPGSPEREAQKKAVAEIMAGVAPLIAALDLFKQELGEPVGGGQFLGALATGLLDLNEARAAQLTRAIVATREAASEGGDAESLRAQFLQDLTRYLAPSERDALRDEFHASFPIGDVRMLHWLPTADF